MLKRPEVTDELPKNLCLDAGYTGKEHEKDVKERNYIPRIPRLDWLKFISATTEEELKMSKASSALRKIVTLV